MRGQNQPVAKPTGCGDRARRHFLRQTGLGLVSMAAVSAEAVSADPPMCEVQAPPATGQEQRARAYDFPRVAQTRVRKSLFEVATDKKELDRLAQAFDLIRKLDKNDTRAWCHQANLHDQHCSYGPDSRPAGQPAYYLQIHFGWFFLPWHRAYLYFYESILQELLKDDTFALPYWDWSQNPTIPDAFFDAASPLYRPGRDARKGQSITDDIAVHDRTKPLTVEAVKSIPYFYPPLPSLTGSLGGPPDNDQSSGFLQGALEANPHNAIHNWVGGDMGSFNTAARDPLFFLHHANVDKVWADWQLMPGHTNPSSASWLSQWFNFFEPKKGEQISVTVADTIDFTRVNVIYEPYRSPAARGSQAKLAQAKPKTLADGPVEVEARTLRARPARAALAAVPRRTIRLTVDGYQDPGDVAVRIHAFLNKPDADATTPLTDEHYVGTFFIVPMVSKGAAMPGHAKMAHPARTLNLDITERAAPLLGEGQPTIKLVPVDRNQKPVKANVQFKSVAILED
jgi:Common central domain of tyrosinase